jgi:L-aminopeptidase/D-esterase-like protein
VVLEGLRPLALSALGTLAADALARAIGRAIWEAEAVPGWPAYRDGPGAAA